MVLRRLAGVAPWFIGAGLYAAPLTWFPGPPLDAPLSAAAAVVYGGNNLLIGGDAYYGSGGYPESLAATNAYWTYLPALFGAPLAPGAIVNGGMIIVYGGSDGTNALSTAVGYSPSGDAPQSLASMSVARSDLGYAPDRNGFAYALGGLDGSGQPLASAERYDTDADSWAAIAPLPSARYHFPAVFNGTNAIYVFGGYTTVPAGAESASVLRYSVSGGTWSAMASMPIAVAGSAATLGPDGRIYVAGGTSAGVTTNVVQVYSMVSNSWAISTPLPEGLSAAAMGVDSLGRLLVMGGVDTNGNDVSDVWRSQQLNLPDLAPTFVSYPGTTARYQVSYVSSISATGNPQPTYLMVSGPTGMQVDPYSGAITWTPEGIQQIGAIPVTLRATNYAGYVDWQFTINVPNPPPVTPSNVHVLSATENSVTLAWDPQSPEVGPATFKIFIPHPWHSPRGSGGGVNYQLIGSTTATNLTLANLSPNTTYGFDVNATAAGGTSGYAGVTATTLGPQPPTNLWVTGVASTTISLAWDPSPGPVPITRYEILGWIGGLFPTISYGTNFSGTTATITGLTPGTYEEWTVRGYDAGGNVSGFAAGIYAVNPRPAAASLSRAAPSPSGGFQFAVTAGGGSLQTVLFQATTNPADPSSWVQIGALLPTTNVFTFTDTNASSFPMRFYRVVSP